jgi:hypothetical protein
LLIKFCFIIIGGGQGEKIERLYREVRAFAIPGGSEGKLDVVVDIVHNR